MREDFKIIKPWVLGASFATIVSVPLSSNPLFMLTVQVTVHAICCAIILLIVKKLESN
jgi:hypothetical protein